MSLGAFISDFSEPEILQRLSEGESGVFLVEDGVLHAVVKKDGKPSKLLEVKNNIYALSEDIRSRGFNEDEADSRVKVIKYPDLVDLITKEYKKLAWL